VSAARSTSIGLRLALSYGLPTPVIFEFDYSPISGLWLVPLMLRTYQWALSLSRSRVPRVIESSWTLVSEERNCSDRRLNGARINHEIEIRRVAGLWYDQYS